MKLDILTFCLLCFHFEPLHGADNCSSDHCSSLPSWKHLCKDTNPQLNDRPRDTFIFRCPLPNTTNFNMKLFKGKEKAVICDLYVENEAVTINKTEFCVPVYSSGCEVKFLLSNLLNKHSDTYTCCFEMLLPQYYQCKSNEINLHIKDPEHCLLSEMMQWILIGLSVFSTAACICCFIACYLRKVICQKISPGSYDYSNEYMSMAAVKLS